ncbi:MAG: NAD(P)-binding protein [Panacagrimonas sp.]
MSKRLNIAIIGTGIAGLSAAWFLGQRHRVSLYERGPQLGMDAHTAQVACGEGQSVDINVPMRVFFQDYCPTLTQIYQSLGVAYEPVQYSGSFSRFGGDTYFRYRNWWFGARSVSFLAGRSLWSARAMRIGTEILRFMRRPSSDIPAEPSLDGISIEAYLQREGYSRSFAEDFLYPTFSGICTCSYEHIKAYPASIIRDYLQSGLMGSRVNRLVHGTRDAASRMAANAETVHYQLQLKSVMPVADGVQVSDGNGHQATYDHIVVATQANHALDLLQDANGREQQVLRKFTYEASKVVVHRDARLAPRQRSEWAPVNFLLSATQDKPMASIWLNSIHPQLKGRADLFETWNPYIEIPQDQILIEAGFERPLVTQESLQAIDQLAALHQESERRIWFCGSYARRGIPLLESAAASAKAIADRLLEVDARQSLHGVAP